MNETQDMQDQESRDRLDRLSRGAGQKSTFDTRYSIFIRRMRLILPLVALGIVAVVFTWSYIQAPHISSIEEKTANPRAVAKNELLNPRFESRDEKDQPYTITAQRALQGKMDEDLILLEKPLADMLLNSGHWIAIEAAKGAFQQKSQKLLLNGDVRLFHDTGYQMEMSKLNVDMKEHTAWSDVDIYAQGPAGMLNAKGLSANAKIDILVFSGPAKLVLYQGASTEGLEGIMP